MSFPRSHRPLGPADPTHEARRRAGDPPVTDASAAAALTTATSRWPPAKLRGVNLKEFHGLAHSLVVGPASFSDFARLAAAPPTAQKAIRASPARTTVTGASVSAQSSKSRQSAKQVRVASKTGYAVEYGTGTPKASQFQPLRRSPVSRAATLVDSSLPHTPSSVFQDDSADGTQWRIQQQSTSGNLSQPSYDNEAEAWIMSNMSDADALLQQEGMLIAEVSWWRERAKDELQMRQCYEAELEAQCKTLTCEVQNLREQLQVHQQRAKLVKQVEDIYAAGIATSKKDAEDSERLIQDYEQECLKAEEVSKRLRNEVRQHVPPNKSKLQLLSDADADRFRKCVEDEISLHFYPLPGVDRLPDIVQQAISHFEEVDRQNDLRIEKHSNTALTMDRFSGGAQSLEPHAITRSKSELAATRIQSIYRGRVARAKTKDMSDEMSHAFKKDLTMLQSHHELSDIPIVGILGDKFNDYDSEELVATISSACGNALEDRVKFLTYSLPEIQTTFARECGDCSSVVNLVGCKLPPEGLKGLNIAVDNRVRRALFNTICHIYIAIEVGEEHARDVSQLLTRQAPVIPVQALRGYPQHARRRPGFASEKTWEALNHESHAEIASAVVDILDAFVKQAPHAPN